MAETSTGITLKIEKGTTFVRENKIGRNDACSCGSGKKYKKCCLDKVLTYHLKVEHRYLKSFYCLIEIGGDETLYDLHGLIQKAYKWDDDHMFAFLMDNNFTRSNQEYRGNPLGEGNVNIALKKFRLKKNQEFGYLFDFGDNHEFTVTVMDVTDPNSNFESKLTRFGSPPEQYG